jgi:hypothetical protein
MAVTGYQFSLRELAGDDPTKYVRLYLFLKRHGSELGIEKVGAGIFVAKSLEALNQLSVVANSKKLRGVALELGVNPLFLYRAAKKGYFKVQRIGNRLYADTAEAARFLNEWKNTLTLRQASRLFRVNVQTLRRWVERGIIKLRFGRLPRDELEAILSKWFNRELAERRRATAYRLIAEGKGVAAAWQKLRATRSGRGRQHFKK